MGGDGGQVIDRATMVKTKGWGLTKGTGGTFAASLGEMNSYVQMIYEDRGLGVLQRHSMRMTSCYLSQEALKEPIVADKLGNLYNKEAVIGALLNRSIPEALGHLRGLKDVKQCVITWAEHENEEDKRSGMVCPVSREDLDTGSARAVVIWTTGAVISAKCLKEMKLKDCPVTGKPFDQEKDVIPIAPEGEELAKLKEKLPVRKRKASELAAAVPGEGTSASSSAIAEGVKAEGVVKTEEVEKNLKEIKENGTGEAKARKWSKEELLHASKNSDVYKKLFTGDRKGFEGVRDAFGTPIYNRGSRCL
ncbi:unnamed protein product [Polarella glacialis]|uniref:Replication termination factor 2 n=1 Tax=Polarella glacialis TaxID=89957 RepID=A0A813HFG6_POLGL|nr:unnamed protein product [Polarella glacialis]